MIAAEWRIGDLSIRALFERAAPDLGNQDAIKHIRSRLGNDEALVEAWQTYSYDKRGSPSPYLDGCEVGFYDSGCRDVTRYDNKTEACADFVWREANWVLRRQR